MSVNDGKKHFSTMKNPPHAAVIGQNPPLGGVITRQEIPFIGPQLRSRSASEHFPVPPSPSAPASLASPSQPVVPLPIPFWGRLR